jgi:hypothetical protein
MKRRAAERPQVQNAAESSPYDFAGLLAVAGEGAQAIDSPARRLQEELEANFAGPQAARWSARRRLAFIVGASAALWGALIWGVVALA